MSEFLDLVGKDMLVHDPANQHDARMGLSRLREIQSRWEESRNYACLSKHASPQKHSGAEPDSRKPDIQARKAQILTGI